MKKMNICKFDEAGAFSSLGISNLNSVTSGAFGARSAADELDDLANAVANDEEIYVDEEGVLHRANDVEGLSTLNTSNLTKVNSDPFAGGTSNLFTEDTASEIEINDLGFPQTPSEQTANETDVSIQLENAGSNEEDILLDDSALTMELDEEGIIQSTDDTMDTNTDGEQEIQVSGHNMTRISSKPFAAADIRKPSNPDQWYNKNTLLFKAEVANMRRFHPNAKLGFFKTTGNMYWLIETKIAKGVKPWHFVLEYEKNHPNNYSYGGSIHVQLLKSPSLEDLRARARVNGRMGIPHVVSSTRANGESYTYLCTRRPDDVNSGESLITSAVQVAGWAADWALHFETGMRSKEVWNKWCDDSHFRYLMIP